MHLLPCPSCSRHVVSTEVSCPFCASVLPEWMATSAPPALPKSRLGRAALLCAGVAGTTAACGGVVESDSMTPTAGMSAASGSSNASAGQGMGGMGNAGMAGMGGMDDTFLPTPEYGVPILPPEAAGSTSMGGTSGVGRDPIDDVGVPIYGLPPVESE